MQHSRICYFKMQTRAAPDIDVRVREGTMDAVAEALLVLAAFDTTQLWTDATER